MKFSMPLFDLGSSWKVNHFYSVVVDAACDLNQPKGLEDLDNLFLHIINNSSVEFTVESLQQDDPLIGKSMTRNEDK